MKPIERVSMVEQVIERLTKYITENNLISGNKMPTENEVCQMTGVGRSTVREAYRMMQAMGIIEVQRGKGFFFVNFPKDIREKEVAIWFRENGQNIADYMEVRLAIETMASKLALQHYEEKNFKEIENFILIQKKEISEITDPSKRAAKTTLYDEEFHKSLTKISGNDLLIKIQQNISDCLAVYRNQIYMLDENIERAHESHWNILTAFISQNEDSVIEQLNLHLMNSLTDMEKIQNRVFKNKKK